MFIPSKLVFKYYSPLKIEKGQMFLYMDNDVMQVHTIDKVPLNKEQYLTEHGYPAEPYILSTDNDEILAYPEEIGWMDAGDDSDELSDISLANINDILSNDGECFIEIDDDSQGISTHMGKVVIRLYDDEDDDDFSDWDETLMDGIENE